MNPHCYEQLHTVAEEYVLYYALANSECATLKAQCSSEGTPHKRGA